MSGLVWTWPKRGSSTISTTLHFQTRKTINFAQISMYYNCLFIFCDDMLASPSSSLNFQQRHSLCTAAPSPEKNKEKGLLLRFFLRGAGCVLRLQRLRQCAVDGHGGEYKSIQTPKLVDYFIFKTKTSFPISS